MKDERTERVERTLEIFKDQMERVLDKNYGLIVVFGDDTGGGTLVFGNNINALSALSMSMCKSKELRDMIVSSIGVAEHAKRELNNKFK